MGIETMTSSRSSSFLDDSPAGPPNSLPSGLSVVVPVYNSQDTLSELVERLSSVLPGLVEMDATVFEVILVNDGSRDESWEESREGSSAGSWAGGCGWFWLGSTGAMNR